MIVARLIAAFVLLSALQPLIAMANGRCDNNPEFRFPGTEKALAMPERTAWYANYFPAAVVDILRRADSFLEYQYEQEGEYLELEGYEFDLNNDSHVEYIVLLPGASGHGGSTYIIISQARKIWTNIGTLSGGWTPLATSTDSNGERWRDLGVLWRFGQDNAQIGIYRFDKETGEYKVSESISCKDGKVIK